MELRPGVKSSEGTGPDAGSSHAGRPRLLPMLNTFAVTTSAHGVMKLTSPVWFVQALWAILIMGALSGFLYNTSLLVQKYLSRPISTSITQDGVTFQYPDITVCNSRLLSVSQMAVKSDNVSFIDSAAVAAARWSWTPEAAQFFANLRSLHSLAEYFVTTFLQPQFSSGLYRSAKLLQMTDQLMNELPGLVMRDTLGTASMRRFAQPDNLMLLSCRYGAQPCDHESFGQTSAQLHTVCMLMRRDQFITTVGLEPGDRTDYPLRMLAYTDSHASGAENLEADLQLTADQLFKQGQEGGVDIFVHEPGSHPYTGDQMHISVGFQATVTLGYEELHSISRDLRPCVSALDADSVEYWTPLENGSLVLLSYRFTRMDCVYEKLQLLMRSACGCYLYDVPLAGRFSLTEHPFCYNLTHLLLANSQPVSSVSDIQARITSGKVTNGEADSLLRLAANYNCSAANYSRLRRQAEGACQPACKSSDYDAWSELETWPTSDGAILAGNIRRWLAANTFYRNGEPALNLSLLRQLNRGLFDVAALAESGGASLARRNLIALLLRVADGSDRAVLMKETLAFDLSDMFSGLGGLFGLYLGVSVLTLCELLELGLHLLWLLSRCLSHDRTGPEKPIAPVRVAVRKAEAATS